MITSVYADMVDDFMFSIDLIRYYMQRPRLGYNALMPYFKTMQITYILIGLHALDYGGRKRMLRIKHMIDHAEKRCCLKTMVERGLLFEPYRCIDFSILSCRRVYSSLPASNCCTLSASCSSINNYQALHFRQRA
jgi:hypothetical protein